MSSGWRSALGRRCAFPSSPAAGGDGLRARRTVEEVGQYALRGGIVDVFGFGSPEPGRIELLGDEVESIRFFDILTQLSVSAVEHLHLLPVDRFRPSPATASQGSVESG
jgi:transcription-repair coupling factor (superfamily II helicase)